MELNFNLKHAMCNLFEVHEDESGVQRVITPLEYPGSHDHIVLRVRPKDDHWLVDENGEAAMYARMNGGDVGNDNVQRWAIDLERDNSVQFAEEETLSSRVFSHQMLAPTLFRVASAAQQLYTLATAHKERQASHFKELVTEIVNEICSHLKVPVQHNARLPISGELEADHLIGSEANPLIVISATSAKRLLEAEIIHMQYRLNNTPGFVLAVTESQKIVGVKQFMRANYYTGKTVEFNPTDFKQLLRSQVLH
jgi:hypothetical protein